MNFFEQQERARSRTGWLVVLFLLAVVCLIVATCLLLAVFIAGSSVEAVHSPDIPYGWAARFQHIPLDTYLGVAASVTCLVGVASLFRLLQLSGGGAVVADALGGRLVNINTRNADEKKLLNVVEEMAIASGVSVPSVYLLEESSINAFAAGTRPDNAVIGITRGAIEQLSRDELQGVIAHEFSHIFNGDMRLNLRLIGLLYGILVIGIIGQHILRAASRGSLRSRNNNGALAFVALGAGLMVIGYAGTFFGNLIKAAVSRQREFLADASAVQFTRDTQGIAGALKKIGHFGSRLDNSEATELSHLFFSQGVGFYLNRLFATHPPLEERIQRIDKGWTPSQDGALALSTASGPITQLRETTPDVLAAGFQRFSGEPDLTQRQYAQRFLHELPADILEAAHEPYGARALVFALLLDSDDSRRASQLILLANRVSPVVYGMVEHFHHTLQGYQDDSLAIVDLALPALQQLERKQAVFFCHLIEQLTERGVGDDLYRWSLSIIVCGRVLPAERARQFSLGAEKHLKLLAPQLRLICSALAYAGAGNTTSVAEPLDLDQQQIVEQSFQRATRLLGLPHAKMLFAEDIRVEALQKALTQLSRIPPLQKPRLLKALAQAAAADGVLRGLEIQMVRAFAQLLDCPAPVLLQAGQ